MRVAGIGGVIGVDLSAALKLAEVLNYDSRAVAELFPYVEAGIVSALAKKGDGDGE